MSPVLQPDTSQATDFQASKPNTYAAIIRDVEVVRSKEPNKKSGNYTNGIQPTFEFEAPRLADGEVRKVTRRKWIAIDGKGTFSFDQLLRCLGEKDLADAMKARPGQVPFDTDLLLNKPVNIVVTTTVYEGKQQDDIDSFIPAA